MHWYYTLEDIELNTPSRRDGIDFETEHQYRSEGARFIMDLGNKLGLRYVTMATGIVYYHRFYMFHSFKEFSRWVVSAACLFLAGKVEETPKKCGDVLKVTQRTVTDEQFKTFGENPREEVMICERVLLQTIKFDLQVNHPYQFLIKYGKKLKGNRSKINELVQKAWIFINDSLSTSFCLLYKPEVIALGVLMLAFKLSNLRVRDFMHQPKVDWWESFFDGVKEEDLNYISSELLEMYDGKSPKRRFHDKSGSATPNSQGDSPAINETSPPEKRQKLSSSFANTSSGSTTVTAASTTVTSTASTEKSLVTTANMTVTSHAESKNHPKVDTKASSKSRERISSTSERHSKLKTKPASRSGTPTKSDTNATVASATTSIVQPTTSSITNSSSIDTGPSPTSKVPFLSQQSMIPGLESHNQTYIPGLESHNQNYIPGLEMHNQDAAIQRGITHTDQGYGNLTAATMPPTLYSTSQVNGYNYMHGNQNMQGNQNASQQYSYNHQSTGYSNQTQHHQTTPFSNHNQTSVPFLNESQGNSFSNQSQGNSAYTNQSHPVGYSNQTQGFPSRGMAPTGNHTGHNQQYGSYQNQMPLMGGPFMYNGNSQM